MSNMAEQSGGVNSFQYSEEVLTELESTLSPERLSTYLRVVSDGDKGQGVRLYVWNIALSSAFYGVLYGLEVTLRNSMHGRLSAAYGRAWYENRRVGLGDGCMERIQNVKTSRYSIGILWMITGRLSRSPDASRRPRANGWIGTVGCKRYWMPLGIPSYAHRHLELIAQPQSCPFGAYGQPHAAPSN